jgi:hypothetical protein
MDLILYIFLGTTGIYGFMFYETKKKSRFARFFTLTSGPGTSEKRGFFGSI